MKTSQYSSPLAPALDRFLAYKRSLGLVYRSEEYVLRKLDAVAVGKTVLDEPLVRRFIAEGRSGASRLGRLALARQLARFLAIEEPRTFVPPRRFLGAHRYQRPAVRCLSREEAGRFFAVCGGLPDTWCYPHRGLIQGTALRTLLLTGMRRGELLALRQRDVDWEAGVLFVRRGKFGKSRYLPLAGDVVDMLRAYREALRLPASSRTQEAAFFPGPDGRRTGDRTTLYWSFRTVLDRCGIPHGGQGVGPRMHDLRHTFAVLRMLTWYEQGADLHVKLPLLATYLGHVGIESSQVYLHMTYDLVGEVTQRFEARFGDVITIQAAS